MLSEINKSYLRAELKSQRSELSKNGYSKTAGDVISMRISELSQFENADTVMIFYPVGSEINILFLFELAKKRGKRIAFPRSLSGGILDFRYVGSLDELTDVKYNIPEPSEKAEHVADLSRSICITPALAFDKYGYRIGYGGGYYDRFLADYKGYSVGVAYDGMILDSLPICSNDLPVDIIITERRRICPRKKSPQSL